MLVFYFVLLSVLSFSTLVDGTGSLSSLGFGSLSGTGGTLSPPFDPETTEYTVIFTVDQYRYQYRSRHENNNNNNNNNSGDGIGIDTSVNTRAADGQFAMAFSISPVAAEGSNVTMVVVAGGPGGVTEREMKLISGYGGFHGYVVAVVPGTLEASPRVLRITVIEASDGKETVYTFKATRAVGTSTINTLSSLSTKTTGNVAFNDVDAKGRIVIVVDPDTSVLNWEAKTTNSAAVVTISGQPISAADHFGTPIDPGETNNIEIVVIAGDGVSKRTYSVLVVRPVRPEDPVVVGRAEDALYILCRYNAPIPRLLRPLKYIAAVHRKATSTSISDRFTGDYQASGNATEAVIKIPSLRTPYRYHIECAIKTTDNDIVRSKGSIFASVVSRDNDDLSALHLFANGNTNGTPFSLSPAFSAEGKEYTMTVPNNVLSIIFRVASMSYNADVKARISSSPNFLPNDNIRFQRNITGAIDLTSTLTGLAPNPPLVNMLESVQEVPLLVGETTITVIVDPVSIPVPEKFINVRIIRSRDQGRSECGVTNFNAGATVPNDSKSIDSTWSIDKVLRRVPALSPRFAPGTFSYIVNPAVPFTSVLEISFDLLSPEGSLVLWSVTGKKTSSEGQESPPALAADLLVSWRSKSSSSGAVTAHAQIKAGSANAMDTLIVSALIIAGNGDSFKNYDVAFDFECKVSLFTNINTGNDDSSSPAPSSSSSALDTFTNEALASASLLGTSPLWTIETSYATNPRASPMMSVSYDEIVRLKTAATGVDTSNWAILVRFDGPHTMGFNRDTTDYDISFDMRIDSEVSASTSRAGIVVLSDNTKSEGSTFISAGWGKDSLIAVEKWSSLSSNTPIIIRGITSDGLSRTVGEWRSFFVSKRGTTLRMRLGDAEISNVPLTSSMSVVVSLFSRGADVSFRNITISNSRLCGDEKHGGLPIPSPQISPGPGSESPAVNPSSLPTPGPYSPGGQSSTFSNGWKCRTVTPQSGPCHPVKLCLGSEEAEARVRSRLERALYANSPAIAAITNQTTCIEEMFSKCQRTSSIARRTCKAISASSNPAKMASNAMCLTGPIVFPRLEAPGGIFRCTSDLDCPTSSQLWCYDECVSLCGFSRSQCNELVRDRVVAPAEENFASGRCVHLGNSDSGGDNGNNLNNDDDERTVSFKVHPASSSLTSTVATSLFAGGDWGTFGVTLTFQPGSVGSSNANPPDTDLSLHVRVGGSVDAEVANFSIDADIRDFKSPIFDLRFDDNTLSIEKPVILSTSFLVTDSSELSIDHISPSHICLAYAETNSHNWVCTDSPVEVSSEKDNDGYQAIFLKSSLGHFSHYAFVETSAPRASPTTIVSGSSSDSSGSNEADSISEGGGPEASSKKIIGLPVYAVAIIAAVITIPFIGLVAVCVKRRRNNGNPGKGSSQSPAAMVEFQNIEGKV